MVMVKGLDVFRDHFRDYQGSYVLIGDVACYLVMEDAGVDFSVTKDLDIVSYAEALDSAFIAHFWESIKAGGYQNQQKNAGAIDTQAPPKGRIGKDVPFVVTY